MGTGAQRILIIDDDNRNIFALSAVLRSRGYETVPAASAQEGLRILRQNEGIKVVLMDIMMPGMDGYEAIRRIREENRFRSLPIIAVTAQAMPGDREKCMAAGATNYISKPIDVDRLLELLETSKEGK
jgi:two-component system, cell cycle response regulator DivK